MRCKSTLVWGLAAGCTLPLIGQAPGALDAEQELAALLNTPIDVSASKPTTLFASPSTVSVVDRDTLDRHGIQTLAEALELVSGMYVSRTLFHRDMPTSRGVLQEGYANRVLLLINGVASWNTLTGDLMLARVDIEDVERIEVLKGPGSVLYGTNAYAGAINVVLRREGETRTRVHAGHQDQGGYRIGASHTQRLGGWTLYAGAHAQHDLGKTGLVTGEPGPSYPAYPFPDRQHIKNATLQVEGHGLTIIGNAFHQETTWFGAAHRASFGGGSLWEDNGHFLHLRYGFKPIPSLELRYAVTHDASSRQSPQSLANNTQGLRQRGSRLWHQVSGRWDLDRAWSLELGASTEKRSNDYYQSYDNATGTTVSENNLNGASVKEDSAFFQIGWTPEHWNVLVGTRLTNNEFAGRNVSSRITAVYSLNERNSLKLIFGQSFRAPALLEQRIDFPSIAGNPDLKPETSDSLELAYMGAFGDFFFQAIAFHTRFDQKAYRARRQPTDSRPTYLNADEFKVSGLELEIKYQNSKYLNAFLNIDYMKGDNGDEVDSSIQYGYNYKMVPKFSASLGVSRSWGGFTASLLANHQSSNDGPRGPVDGAGYVWGDVPAWTGVDLSAGYQFRWDRRTLRLTAAVKNAGDKERWFPEATRRAVNMIPLMEGRKGILSAAFTF